MSPYRIKRALHQWWWLVVVSIAVASVASFLSTLAMQRQYVSHTTLMVGQTLQNQNSSTSDIFTGQTLAQSYVDLVKREPLLKATLETLGLRWDWTDLEGMVSSRAIPGTPLLEISVTDTDPQRARVLADEIVHQLILQSPAGVDKQGKADQQFVQAQRQELKASIEKSREEIRALDDVIAKATSARQIQEARDRQAALQSQISGWEATYAQFGTVLQSSAPNFLTVMEPAQVPKAPVGPDVVFNVLAAAMIGLALASGAVLALAFIDDSLKTSDDVRQLLDLNTLGSISNIEGDDYPSQLIVVKQPRSPTAEAFRMLRTNLPRGSTSRPLRTLLVTSSGPEEGKSLTAANLAVAIAQFGKRVILVDADLRRPTVHNIFELNNQKGLSTTLASTSASLDEMLQDSSVENLRVLTSGPLPPNPAELLSSKRMVELVALLRQSADIIIFDSPPVLVAADTTALAASVDNTLLVVNSGHTRQARARHCKQVLEAVKANISGVVINRLPLRETGYYHHYYTEEGERHKWRAPKLPVPVPRPPAAHGPIPQAKSVAASTLQAKVSLTQTEMGSHVPQLGQAKPHPGIITPAVTRTVPKAPVTSQRARPSATETYRVQRRSAPSVVRWTDKIRRMAKRKGLGIVAFGSVALVVLTVALALSLSRQPSPRRNSAPTVAVAIVQVTAVSTPAPTGTTADLADATTVKGPDITQSPTEPPQPDAGALAATGTAVAGGTATQVAINATAAQQAIGLLNCGTLEFEILESPPGLTRVTSGMVDVEFIWRVRNQATLSYCKWGQEKQETRLIQAVEVGKQRSMNIPVTLKWLEDDEYNLSIKTRLGAGVYDASWRLQLPKMTSPGGPTLQARAVVLKPTLTSTPTFVPTPTACPEKVYSCNCHQECSGRTCTQVCDECYRQECK